jgi:hypothetical protein
MVEIKCERISLNEKQTRNPLPADSSRLLPQRPPAAMTTLALCFPSGRYPREWQQRRGHYHYIHHTISLPFQTRLPLILRHHVRKLSHAIKQCANAAAAAAIAATAAAAAAAAAAALQCRVGSRRQ